MKFAAGSKTRRLEQLGLGQAQGLGSAEAAKCPAQLPLPRAGALFRASPSPPGWQAPFRSCEAAWTPPAISSLLSLPCFDCLLLCLSACVFSLSFILFLSSFFVSPCVFVCPNLNLFFAFFSCLLASLCLWNKDSGLGRGDRLDLGGTPDKIGDLIPACSRLRQEAGFGVLAAG